MHKLLLLRLLKIQLNIFRNATQQVPQLWLHAQAWGEARGWSMGGKTWWWVRLIMRDGRKVFILQTIHKQHSRTHLPALWTCSGHSVRAPPQAQFTPSLVQKEVSGGEELKNGMGNICWTSCCEVWETVIRTHSKGEDSLSAHPVSFVYELRSD